MANNDDPTTTDDADLFVGGDAMPQGDPDRESPNRPIGVDEHPDYDAEALQAALPKVARMDFSQKLDGMIVIKLVARDQSVTEVDLGTALPRTTADLIETITAYQATKIDTTLAEQAAEALDFDV